jgi:hypothetical protein
MGFYFNIDRALLPPRPAPRVTELPRCTLLAIAPMLGVPVESIVLVAVNH